MGYREAIAQRWELLNGLADQNKMITAEIFKIISDAESQKERRVLIPGDRTCLVAQVRKKRDKIKENNTLMDEALEEITQYVLTVFG